MRPDLDEFEEMNEPEAERSSRAMSWVVLSVAVIGFGALAYYAYQSGTQSVGDGQMLVVNADPSPIKEAPADAGGEQFPNKDKTIYDTLSPYRTDEHVEKLLPEPEEPVIPEPAVGADVDGGKNGTTTFVNEAANKSATEVETPAVAASEDEEADETAPVAKEATPASQPQTVTAITTPAPVAAPLTEKPAPTEVAEVPVATTTTTVAEKKPEPTVVAAPVEKKVEPAPVKKAEPVKKPEPKPVTAASGEYKIQLGAFKSDAEARATWSKITAKSGDVVKGSPIIVKADVNGTTYYRLRASGFASPDAAKKACATLSSRGQACFYAGK